MSDKSIIEYFLSYLNILSWVQLMTVSFVLMTWNRSRHWCIFYWKCLNKQQLSWFLFMFLTVSSRLPVVPCSFHDWSCRQEREGTRRDHLARWDTRRGGGDGFNAFPALSTATSYKRSALTKLFPELRYQNSQLVLPILISWMIKIYPCFFFLVKFTELR